MTIWHEQIIDMFAVLTGCDRALAEVARRALANGERLPQVEAWFKGEAGRRGYSRAVLDEVWEIIKGFGAYGFCRAHAVAFAIPALQSAWLKAHHPAALYAGLLEHDPGMWPPRVIVSDARRHDVPVLNVDINRSAADYRIEQTEGGVWGVRLSMSSVKGISEDQVARITSGQPYNSLQDFWQRARPALPIAERLIQIGALDPLRGPLTRRDLLLQAAELHAHTRARPADGQLPLGGELVTAEPSGLPEMTSREALSAEIDVLKIDVSRHLMTHHHRLLREIGATDAAHLKAMYPGQRVLVAGVRASTQTPPIPSGKRVIFVTLEDGSGLVDIAFFEDSHDAVAHTVFHSALLLVRGTVEARGPRRTVVGQMVWDLEELAAARRDHGPEAVLTLLGQSRLAPTPRAERRPRAHPGQRNHRREAPPLRRPPTRRHPLRRPQEPRLHQPRKRRVTIAMAERRILHAHWHLPHNDDTDLYAQLLAVAEGDHPARAGDRAGRRAPRHHRRAPLLATRPRRSRRAPETAHDGPARCADHVRCGTEPDAGHDGGRGHPARHDHRDRRGRRRAVAAAAPGSGPLRHRPGDRGQAAHVRPAHHRGRRRDPLPTLVRLFGASAGRSLHAHAHGQDPRTVQAQPIAKSLAADRAFEHDALDPAEHRRTLLDLAEEVAARLRDGQQAAGGLALSVRYADRSTSTRRRTLAEATAHTRPIATTAYELYDLLALQRARVRAIGLRAHDLRPSSEATQQLTLDAGDDRALAIEAVTDRARARYGTGTIRPAALAKRTKGNTPSHDSKRMSLRRGYPMRPSQ
ncbi:hypothetical protein GCM10020254_86940 [Streptomyces goshikiensis]